MTMRQYIQKIATGPELSKDLSREEAHDGMRLILSGDADPVQAAIFLIALRMKRETMPENLGVLDALLDQTHQARTTVDDVLDLSDPFDGFTRGMPAAPFLPAVLAACGVATVCNGAESIGPKYGATHRKVLRSAGIGVDLSPEEASKQLADPDIGWAYVDQKTACPALHDLVSLRTKIVKRPCLTTLEVLLGPVRGAQRTHLMTGYVHKPYPPIYTALARASDYASAIIVRGVEGGVIPSLNQPSKLFSYGPGGLISRSGWIRLIMQSSLRVVPSRYRKTCLNRKPMMRLQDLLTPMRWHRQRQRQDLLPWTVKPDLCGTVWCMAGRSACANWDAVLTRSQPQNRSAVYSIMVRQVAASTE